MDAMIRWCPSCKKAVGPTGNELMVIAPLICPECGSATDSFSTTLAIVGCLGKSILVGLILIVGCFIWFTISPPKAGQQRNAAPNVQPAPATAPVVAQPVQAMPAIEPAAENPVAVDQPPTIGQPAEIIEPKPAVDHERVAASQLKLAKNLATKSPAKYRERLQEIIDQHPNTDAAKEAAKLLFK